MNNKQFIRIFIIACVFIGLSFLIYQQLDNENNHSGTTTFATAKVLSKQKITPSPTTEIYKVKFIVITVSGSEIEYVDLNIKNKNLWNLIQENQLYRISYDTLKGESPFLREIEFSKSSIQKFDKKLKEIKIN